jgi:hypothetical protein
MRRGWRGWQGTRPRGGGAPVDEDEHEGLAAWRRGHAHVGDEARTDEDTVLRSSEDNDKEAGVMRMTPRGGGALMKGLDG